VTTRS